MIQKLNFQIEEIKPKEVQKVKTLHDLIHKPRLYLKENKIRNYSVQVFIINNEIIFKYKEQEIKGTIDELKKIFIFAKDFSFGTSLYTSICLETYFNAPGNNNEIVSKSIYISIKDKNITINIDKLPIYLNEIEKIINEGEKQYILKHLKTFLDWSNISIEKNKYYHFSIPDGLQDGLVRKEFNLEQIYLTF